MTALGHIRSAIDSGNYEQILEGVDIGVSANLREAVASLQPTGDQAQLQIRMGWSASRPRLPKRVGKRGPFADGVSKSSESPAEASPRAVGDSQANRRERHQS